MKIVDFKIKKTYFIITLVVLCLLFLLIHINYKCPFLNILHLYCPGCGGIRMIKSIIELDFYQAFRYNPLLFILLIIFCIYMTFNLFLYIKKKAIMLPSTKVLISLLIILIIYMIIRNIDYFSYLIPTEV